MKSIQLTLFGHKIGPELMLLVAILFTLPLHVRYGNIAIITLAAYSIFLWFYDREMRAGVSPDWTVLFPGLLFFAYLIGIFWATDMKEGWSQLEKRLPMLFVPLSVWLVRKRLGVRELRIMLYALVVFCVVVSIVCYGNALYNIISNHSLEVVGEKERVYYYYSYIYLTEIVDISPIYLSLYVNLCIAILSFVPLKNRYVNAGLIAYLVVFVILIGSKIGIVWLPLFFALRLAALVRSKVVRFVMMGLIVVAAYVLISRVEFLRDRFFARLEFDFTAQHSSEWNSTSQRLAIWTCTWEAIEDKFPLGYGTGNGQEALNNSYRNHGYVRGYEDNNNTHNEVLAVALELGLAGVIVFLVVFLVPLVQGFIKKNNLLTVFLIMFLVYFLIEVLLTRRTGIVFFSLFYPLVVLLNSVDLKKLYEI